MNEEGLENILERDLPRSAVKEMKRHPVVYVVSVLLLLMLSGGLGFTAYAQTNNVKKERNASDILSGQLVDSKKELDIIKTKLSQTEQGKKQIEDAKAQVESDKSKLEGENSQLDKRASSAEQTAAAARASLSQVKGDLDQAKRDLDAKKSDLDHATTDLNNKKSDLDNAQKDLASKQAELSKVNRCVSLFNNTKSKFTLFDQVLGYALDWSDKTINYLANGQGDLAAGTYAHALEWFGKAGGYRGEIDVILNKVISGNCDQNNINKITSC